MICLKKLRKIINSGRSATVEHKDKQKSRIHPGLAHRILSKHMKLDPKKKEEMLDRLLQSPRHLHAYLDGRKIDEANYMYHGSPKTDIKKFEPDRKDFMTDRAIGTHFAANPDISKKFMRKQGSSYSEVDQAKEGSGKLYKFKAPKRSELETVKQGRHSDQHAIGVHVAHTVFSRPEHKEFFKKWVMHDRHVDEPTAEKIHQRLTAGKSLSRKEYGVASNQGQSMRSFINNYGGNIHNDAIRHKLVGHYLDIQRKKGIKGLVYHNTSPEETKGIGNRSKKSYVIHDPEHLHSIDEAKQFDCKGCKEHTYYDVIHEPDGRFKKCRLCGHETPFHSRHSKKRDERNKRHEALIQSLLSKPK